MQCPATAARPPPWTAGCRGAPGVREEAGRCGLRLRPLCSDGPSPPRVQLPAAWKPRPLSTPTSPWAPPKRTTISAGVFALPSISLRSSNVGIFDRRSRSAPPAPAAPPLRRWWWVCVCGQVPAPARGPARYWGPPTTRGVRRSLAYTAAAVQPPASTRKVLRAPMKGPSPQGLLFARVRAPVGCPRLPSPLHAPASGARAKFSWPQRPWVCSSRPRGGVQGVHAAPWAHAWRGRRAGSVDRDAHIARDRGPGGPRAAAKAPMRSIERSWGHSGRPGPAGWQDGAFLTAEPRKRTPRHWTVSRSLTLALRTMWRRYPRPRGLPDHAARKSGVCRPSLDRRFLCMTRRRAHCPAWLVATVALLAALGRAHRTAAPNAGPPLRSFLLRR